MGNPRWTQRQHCGESSLIVVDPRAAALCPSTDHLWVVESATRHSVERLRCVNTGVDVPLRAWEETITQVEFSRSAPLKVFYRVRQPDGALRTEQRSTSSPRRAKPAIALPSELRSSGASAPNGVRVVRDDVLARRGVRYGRRRGFGLFAIGERVRRKITVDPALFIDSLSSDSEALDWLPAGWKQFVLRDDDGYLLRGGDTVGLFDARSGALLRQWRNAEPIAMNARSIAFVRDGHVSITARSSSRSTEDGADFTAARALWITDSGVVVAQDSTGATRWWSATDGSLLCEHSTTNSLVGLARGGVEAVFFEPPTSENEHRAALRTLVVHLAIAEDARRVALPATTRSIQCFSDDLRDIVVSARRIGARETLHWIHDGALAATAAVGRAELDAETEGLRTEVCAAWCANDALTWVAEDRVTCVGLADGAMIERWAKRLPPDATHLVADWGAFSQQFGEHKINAFVTRATEERITVALVRRSRERAAVASLAPVIAWPQLHHRAVGVQIVGESEAEVLSCVANDAADTVHSIALSPHGTWLAVALRSGKIPRFERSEDATA